MGWLFLDVSLRAFALAGLAGLLAIAVRRHPAAERALWNAVLAGMLAMPFVSRIAPRTHVPTSAASVIRNSVVNVVPEPLGPPAIPGPVVVTTRNLRELPFGSIYALVAALLLARLALGLYLTRRALRSARPIARELWMHDDLIHGAGVRVRIEEFGRVRVPLTCGFRTARIIFPIGWREWPASTLRMVLAHELAHARHRDLAAAFVASVNQALFWFHPVSWWLKRRLALLAERVADQSAVAESNDQAAYAQVLLRMAASTNGSSRIAWSGAAIAESFLSNRVKRVLHGTCTRPRPWMRLSAASSGICLLLLVAGADYLGTGWAQENHTLQPSILYFSDFDNNLGHAQAAQLEQRLAANPEDEHARRPNRTTLYFPRFAGDPAWPAPHARPRPVLLRGIQRIPIHSVRPGPLRKGHPEGQAIAARHRPIDADFAASVLGRGDGVRSRQGPRAGHVSGQTNTHRRP